MPHTTVQQQDTNRKETFKKLIQQFENHPNKESFLQDLNKTEKIHTFSEKSKKLITDMGNTEIFELCETASKKQCSDCALCWEIGIVYCSCGRCFKPSQSTKKLDKKNYDALSIPGYVIKKEPHPWCQTWSFRTATYVPRSQGDVAESSPTQAWWVQNHLGTRITASLFQKLGGLKSRLLFSMTNLHWKITPSCNKRGNNS